MLERRREQGDSLPSGNIITRANLARTYIAKGDYEEAVRRLEELIREYQELLGTTDLHIMRTKTILGRALRLANRFDEAEEVLTSNLADQRILLEPGHPDIRETETQLGKSTEAREVPDR